MTVYHISVNKCAYIFVRLIFIAAINYENIFVTKFSRFTIIYTCTVLSTCPGHTPVSCRTGFIVASVQTNNIKGIFKCGLAAVVEWSGVLYKYGQVCDCYSCGGQLLGDVGLQLITATHITTQHVIATHHSNTHHNTTRIP